MVLQVRALRKVHRRQALAGATPDTGTTDNSANSPDTASNANNAGGNANANANAANAGTSAAGANANNAVNTAATNAGTSTAAADTTTAATPAVSTSKAAVVSTSAAADTRTQSSAKAVSTTAASVSTSQQVVMTTVTSDSVSTVPSTIAESIVKPTTMTGMAAATTPGSITTRIYSSGHWVTFTSAASTGTPEPVSANTSSGPPVGSIIGIVAGSLIGVVCLAATIGYIFRRIGRAKRRREYFNKKQFMRSSVAIPDNDFNEKPRMGTQNALALARAHNSFMAESAGPRPPSMVERRQNGPSYQPGQVVGEAQNTQPQHGNDQQAYYNYQAGYDNNQYQYTQQGGHDNQYDNQGQYVNDAYAYGNGNVGYTAPAEHQQSQLTRKPSAPIRRQNSQRADEPERESYYPDEQRDSYVAYYQEDNGHQSVTPYQQEQYAEISRQLGSTDPQLAVGGGQGNASVERSLSTSYSSLEPKKPSLPNNAGDYDRSGTPTDRNPQQTYYSPTESGPGTPYAAGRHRAVPY